MAQNLAGQETTAVRSDTVSEHLTRHSLTGGNRFRTMLNGQKMNDAGNSAWSGLRSTLGKMGFWLRYRLTRKLK